MKIAIGISHRKRVDGIAEWGVMKSAALETTLGELIVALTDEAKRSLRDEGAAYQVVAYIVSDLLEQGSSVVRDEY